MGLDIQNLPPLFLNGRPYKGEAVFINGYNGYTKTPDDAMLCALINNSAFRKGGRSNILRTANGSPVHSEDHREVTITVGG